MPAHDTQSRAPASASDNIGFRSRVPANWAVEPEKVSDALNMLAAPGATTIVTAASVIPDKALVLGDGGARGVKGSASLSADGAALIGMEFFKIGGVEKNALEFISAGASAVNWLGIVNHVTGNAPILAARGDGTDAHVGVTIQTKGTAESIALKDGNAKELAVFSGVATPANYLEIKNSATGDNVLIAPAGDDANIELEFQSKGGGWIYFNDTIRLGGSVFFSDTLTGLHATVSGNAIEYLIHGDIEWGLIGDVAYAGATHSMFFVAGTKLARFDWATEATLKVVIDNVEVASWTSAAMDMVGEKPLRFADSNKVQLGNAQDFEVYFDGTDGILNVINAAADSCLRVKNTDATYKCDLDIEGDLAVGGAIVSVSNGDIDLTPDGTGEINLNAVTNIPGLGTGGLTAYDLTVGDVTTPDYGMIQMGDAAIGRTSYTTAIDLDGAMLFRNIGGPVTSELEFVFAESGNSVRFAIPKSGAGNATYSARSILLAGPAPLDADLVTVGYWQGQGLFHNLACDTGTDGADLGVQNDLEVEGEIFVDTIRGSTGGSDLTIDSGGAADEIHFHTGGTERARIDVYSRLLLNDMPNPAAGQGWKFQAYEPNLSCQGRYECVSNTANHKASWFLLRTRHTGSPADRAQCNAGDDIGLFGYKLWTSGASTPTRGGLAGFAAAATTLELYLRAGTNADYIHIKDGGDVDFLTSGVRVGFNDAATHYIEHSAGALEIRGPDVVLNAGANERFRGDATGIGLNGAAPVAPTAWTLSNVTPDRVLDADAGGLTLAEVADVLGTLIQDLIDRGDLTTP